jgi:TolA-binding protein
MSTNSTAEPPVSSFDPVLFWTLHRRPIIGGAIAIVLAALAVGFYFGYEAFQAQSATAAYAAASSIDGWRSVIKHYPGSVAAGNASLRIAARLAADGKLAESDTEYENFVHRYAKHPLAVNGYVGLAQNAEAANNLARAAQEYAQAANLFPNSYQAPLALFNQARLTKAQGQDQAARTLFETIVQRFGASFVASMARTEAEKLADKEAH